MSQETIQQPHQLELAIPLRSIAKRFVWEKSSLIRKGMGPCFGGSRGLRPPSWLHGNRDSAPSNRHLGEAPGYPHSRQRSRCVCHRRRASLLNEGRGPMGEADGESGIFEERSAST